MKLSQDEIKLLESLKTGLIKENTYLFYDYTTGQYVYKTGLYTDYYDREKARKKLIEVFSKPELSTLMLDYLPSYTTTFNPHVDFGIFEDDETEVKFFNTFKPTRFLDMGHKFERVDGNDISFLKKYKYFNILLHNLFVKDEYVHYFVNWLSFIVNTKEKTGTAIVLKGVEGTGKDTLRKKLLMKIYHKDYFFVANNTSMSSKFNKSFKDKLFAVFQEVKADMRESTTLYENLKEYITEDVMRIERKGIDEFYVPNFLNCMFFSNNSIPIQLSSTDRRYSVFNTSDTNLKEVCKNMGISSSDFYAKLEEESDAFIEDLINFKWDRDLATSAISTEAKEILAEVTSMKIESVGKKIRTQDCNWLWNKGFEIIGTKLDSGFISESDYRLHLQSLEKFVLEVANGKVLNSALSFAYKLFVKEDETSATKIGNAWSMVLHEKPKVSGGERYRTLNSKILWTKPSFEKKEEEHDPFLEEIQEKKFHDSLNEVVDMMLEQNIETKTEEVVPEFFVKLDEKSVSVIDDFEDEVKENPRENWFFADYKNTATFSEDFEFKSIVLDFKTDNFTITYRNNDVAVKEFKDLTDFEKFHAPSYF